MANETYQWKGAIEPPHDESAGASNTTYLWKGAIEPAGSPAATGNPWYYYQQQTRVVGH